MINHSFFPCLTTVVLSLVLAVPGWAAAQTPPMRTGSVELISKEELVSAYGIVVISHPFEAGASSQSTAASRPEIARRSAAVERISGDHWRVVVDLQNTDFRPRAMLTVIAATASGKVVPGAVRWLNSEGSLVGREFVQCTSTRQRKDEQKLLALDRGALTKLAEYRTKKKELLERLLKLSLTLETYALLNELEKQRGINEERPLTPETPRTELLRRVVALQSVLPSRLP